MITQQIVSSILIVIFASILQGSVGFGFALITVPLLSIFIPIKTVIPVVVVLSAINNLIVLISTKDHIKLKQIWPLIVFGILGIPIGVLGLRFFNTIILRLIVGFIVLATTVIMIKGVKITFKNRTLAFGIAGLSSGILNGSISMSGPPIVLFLTNEGYNKNHFRANLTLNSIITNIAAILIFYFSGILNFQVFKIAGLNTCSIIIGSIIGIYVSKIFNEKIFKNIVLVLLVIISISTILNTIISLVKI